MLTLTLGQTSEIIAHARQAHPFECCGLIACASADRASSVYQLKNVAVNPLVSYEAAPEELFAAQRRMRERGEQLLAIYHSHPRAVEPAPSATDVRLAFYPAAIYLIIGLAGAAPLLRAFRISEKEQRWEAVEYEIVDQ
jgi:proteasome lid subunit RPN8/RPN11